MGTFLSLSCLALAHIKSLKGKQSGFSSIFFFYHSRKDKPPNFFMKLSLGLVAGGIGAFVGTPAEVCLIRMTADGRLVLYHKIEFYNIIILSVCLCEFLLQNLGTWLDRLIWNLLFSFSLMSHTLYVILICVWYQLPVSWDFPNFHWIER